MNTARFQSLCAAVLLIGLIFVGLGGWGTYYFSAKSTSEKEDAAEPSPKPFETPAAVSIQPSLVKSSPTPEKSPEATPAQLAKIAPSLITIPETKSTPTPVKLQAAAATPTPSKQSTGWNLSDKQRQKIVDALGKHAGKSITICSVESDTEGYQFAGTLKHVFEEAGWTVEGVKQIAYSKPPAGLNLASSSFPSPEGVVAAYLAFKSAGFNVSQQLDAKLSSGQAELIVGVMQ